MCRDTVAHVLFPDKEIIDGARWAVVARHGHTFAVDKFVDMAGKEPDKPAAVELFPARCHIELVWASVYNHAIHIFSPCRGPGRHPQPLATLQTEACIGLRLIR